MVIKIGYLSSEKEGCLEVSSRNVENDPQRPQLSLKQMECPRLDFKVTADQHPLHVVVCASVHVYTHMHMCAKGNLRMSFFPSYSCSFCNGISHWPGICSTGVMTDDQ